MNASALPQKKDWLRTLWHPVNRESFLSIVIFGIMIITVLFYALLLIPLVVMLVVVVIGVMAIFWLGIISDDNIFLYQDKIYQPYRLGHIIFYPQSAQIIRFIFAVENGERAVKIEYMYFKHDNLNYHALHTMLHDYAKMFDAVQRHKSILLEREKSRQLEQDDTISNVAGLIWSLESQMRILEIKHNIRGARYVNVATLH